ncbi:MAG: MBL fold metallo-hydrolase [Pseudomonadota bacterium]
MIIEQLIVGFMQVCCYIIGCEEKHEGILVDPAGDEERVLTKVKKLRLSINAIVNTHGHPDHTCGNKKMSLLTNAKTFMHKLDDDLFNSPQGRAMALQLGLPPSPSADGHIKHLDIIKIGKIDLSVIHTPGHSPGSICLYGEKNIFTGDTLFVNGMGRADLPGGSYNTLISSIRDKILTLPDDTIVWPGHDYGPTPSSTVARERQNTDL